MQYIFLLHRFIAIASFKIEVTYIGWDILGRKLQPSKTVLMVDSWT